MVAPVKRRKLRQKVEGGGGDVDAQRDGAAREARARWQRRWGENMVAVGGQDG